MRLTKYLFILFGLISLQNFLLAQKRPEYVGHGNWFLGASGGGSWSLAENSRDSYAIWSPSLSLQFGRTLNKSFSLRLTTGLAPQYGSPSLFSAQYDPDLYRDYQFQTAELFGDALFNVLNHNRQYQEANLLDLHLGIGVGAIYSFGFSSFVDDWDSSIYPVDSQDAFYPAVRLSMIFAHHVAKAWDMQYDFSMVCTSDSYNGVKGGQNLSFLNLYTSARLSLVYYFKDPSIGKHRFGDTPRIILDPYQPIAESDRYAEGDTLRNYISFQIDRDELSSTQHHVLRDIAEYMKQHPDYRFRICGYPDSRRGSEATRLLLARHRCETVLRMLSRKMGIPADRFEIEVNKREHPLTVDQRWNACGVFFVRI